MVPPSRVCGSSMQAVSAATHGCKEGARTITHPETLTYDLMRFYATMNAHLRAVSAEHDESEVRGHGAAARAELSLSK